jgi:G3E family GTPase
MAAEIYIISGFLGAGKTTLIRKLIDEAFKNRRIVVVENDFGEISIDAALLKSGGVEVKEMNSGCICCSLSGDFVKSVKEILDRFHPDIIIIEPSGVGMLSDVIKACSDADIVTLAKVKSRITVVDVKRCKMYLDNFGEFFADQIRHADVILLSRTDAFPGKVNDTRQTVAGLNEHAAIFAKPWNQISAHDIVFPRHDRHEQEKHCGHGCDCHRHGAHGHGDCDHGHWAEDIFDSVTIRTSRRFTVQDLQACMHKLEHNLSGTVLRAKGIVGGADGYMNLQYLPGDLKITNCAAAGDTLCIIGRNLDRQELARLFSGK